MTQAKAAIRDADIADIAAVQAIYAHHVLNGLASYEEVAPATSEMRARYEGVRARGLPYFVAIAGGEIVGYGYCTPFRPRSAYRFCVENSVYVKAGVHRRGAGKALLAALIERCTALGYRQMIAVIGDSANIASIELHASQGFVRAGLLRSTGYKFGRWVDTVLMQRPLGDGDGTLPEQNPAG